MSRGKVAFEAYNKDRGGVNHLGKKTPEWDELPEEIRHAWEVGAEVLEHTLIFRTNPDGVGGGGYSLTNNGVDYTDSDGGYFSIELTPEGTVRFTLDVDMTQMEVPAKTARKMFRRLLMSHFPLPEKT